jgi:hypothetical protein
MFFFLVLYTHSRTTCRGWCHVQVSKMDTVAGLAIKYNVSVSHPTVDHGIRPLSPGVWMLTSCVHQVADIKRANGLLTDTAMFGRETVLIPTQQLPLGCATR